MKTNFPILSTECHFPGLVTKTYQKFPSRDEVPKMQSVPTDKTQ